MKSPCLILAASLLAPAAFAATLAVLPGEARRFSPGVMVQPPLAWLALVATTAPGVGEQPSRCCLQRGMIQ